MSTTKPCPDCAHTSAPGFYAGLDEREPCRTCGGSASISAAMFKVDSIMIDGREYGKCVDLRDSSVAIPTGGPVFARTVLDKAFEAAAMLLHDGESMESVRRSSGFSMLATDKTGQRSKIIDFADVELEATDPNNLFPLVFSRIAVALGEWRLKRMEED